MVVQDGCPLLLVAAFELAIDQGSIESA